MKTVFLDSMYVSTRIYHAVSTRIYFSVSTRTYLLCNIYTYLLCSIYTYLLCCIYTYLLCCIHKYLLSYLIRQSLSVGGRMWRPGAGWVEDREEPCHRQSVLTQTPALVLPLSLTYTLCKDAKCILCIEEIWLAMKGTENL